MPLTDAWRELHRSRFAELPLDCCNRQEPGLTYSEDLRDWSHKATTPDQVRMERYVDRFDLGDKRILHIGIGDSGLARRFHRRTKEIVGTTIDDPEMQVARARQLPNYRFVVHNKYSGSNDTVEGAFDFILDNNPTSPCCCMRHLSDMFQFYSEKLVDGGQIVTDKQGLGWVPDETNPRWSFDFDDLAAVAAVAGFSIFRANSHVYVLARSAPPAPGVVPLSKHLLRRAAMLPGQLVRHGPPKLNRVARKSVKWLLVKTVPWALPARYRPDR